MPDTPIKKTKDKLAKIYLIGILGFSVVVGFITLLAKFLANLSTS